MESNQAENTIFLINFDQVTHCEDEDASTEAIGKRKRTTDEQLNKINLFMQSHSDFTKGSTKVSEAQELAWENLTTELNSMGPPVHSSKEWRTVWSRYKGNKKRKSTLIEPETDTQSSLESCSHEDTDEHADATPGSLNDPVVKVDFKNGKTEHFANENSMKAISKEEHSDNRTVELLNTIVEIETKILDTLVDLKNFITAKLTSA